MTLTLRQKQVLCLIAHPNRGIALRLGISHQTVKNHLTAIYSRLLDGNRAQIGWVNRTRALTAALRAGIVELDEVDSGPECHRDRPMGKPSKQARKAQLIYELAGPMTLRELIGAIREE